ncbi:MAG: hypothetical protein A3I00_05335 [Betaproteobacteria bacterium RIFCSPLOWO2_02_FULL_64_12]|nr:MAG: hypothetical protein A3I00_05335 [Betaproteobacteria bacterium RIFCSPLOWO2_02_FULL_64_12]
MSRCTDAEAGLLVRAFAAEGVRAVVRSTARFNWHWHLSFNLALARERSIATSLFRSLFR